MSKLKGDTTVSRNLKTRSLSLASTTTTVSASTLTLNSFSTTTQIFTGTVAGQIVNLGNATLYPQVGVVFFLINDSSQDLTVKNNSGSTLFVSQRNYSVLCSLESNATANGSWRFSLFLGLNYNQNLSSTATTASGTLTLDKNSKILQVLTGAATGFSVVLPDATTLINGVKFEIINQSSQTVTVKDNTGATLFVLGQTSIGFVTLQANASAAGTWVSWQTFIAVASGIASYNIVSSTAFTTSSTSDVVITGMTVTPTAGTYAVWFNATVFYTATPRVHNWTIYKAGAAVADSSRQQITSRSNQTMFDATQSIVQVNGSQAVDVRVSCDTLGGSLTVNGRSLLLIRLGN